MKRIITVLCMVLLLSLCGCDSVKGQVYDAGRVSVLVPEGWNQGEPTEEGRGKSITMVKGELEDFLEVPVISVMYFLPTENVFSSKEWYDYTDLPDLKTGDYTWKVWKAESLGYEFIVYETEGEFGYLMASVYPRDDKDVAPDGKLVQAVLKSIKTKPVIEVEGIKVNSDGTLTAQLEHHDGYVWEDNGSFVTEGVDAEIIIEGDTLTVKPLSGTGAYVAYLGLYSDTGFLGQTKLSMYVKDGKIQYLTDKEDDIYAEEEPFGNWGQDIDFDEVGKNYIGEWKDEINNATLTVVKDENAENEYDVTVVYKDNTYTMRAYIDFASDLNYDSHSLNGGEKTEGSGWFTYSEDGMSWAGGYIANDQVLFYFHKA